MQPSVDPSLTEVFYSGCACLDGNISARNAIFHQIEVSFMACEAIYLDDRKSVKFAVYPDGFDGPRITAEVTANALRSWFGGVDEGTGLVDAYLRHRELIDETAVRCFRRAPSKAVLLGVGDFGIPGVSVEPNEENQSSSLSLKRDVVAAGLSVQGSDSSLLLV